MAEGEIQIQGEEPSEDDEKWLEYGRKLLEESPKVLDENAKSLVALGSSLLTVYTGALALFGFVEKLGSSSTDLAVMSIPIVLWLLCISFSAYIYFPGRYEFRRDSPDDVMITAENIGREKYRRLKISAIFFILALGSSSFIILWLGQESSTSSLQDPSQKVQFVINEDKVQTLKKMSILTEKGTQRTVPLNLVESTEKAYLVRLSDGRKIEFDKDLAEGTVYV
jgi:hypothetical protein